MTAAETNTKLTIFLSGIRQQILSLLCKKKKKFFFIPCYVMKLWPLWSTIQVQKSSSGLQQITASFLQHLNAF
jgi:hypothetical protein